MTYEHPYNYLLEQFAGEDRKIVHKYLNQIEYIGKNSVIIQCLGPVIAHIVKQVIDKDGAGYRYVKDNIDYLILMIDVKKITLNFIDYCENFLPVAKPYLQNLDSQAELLVLFSNNYVFGLIEKLRISDISVIRSLKLKKLDNYE